MQDHLRVIGRRVFVLGDGGDHDAMGDASFPQELRPPGGGGGEDEDGRRRHDL
jgi:hypothetical protein